MSISAQELLGPLDLTHYGDGLLLNLSGDGGKTLSLKKLGQLRQTHLSQMQITNFEDQRAIMGAIKLALAPPKEQSKSLDDILDDNEAQPKEAKQSKRRGERKSIGRGSFDKLTRRPSFDRKSQMEKINSMRGELDGDAKAKKIDKLRRRSFDPDSKEKKNELMEDVEKNVQADEHAEARITGAGPKRKSMGKDTELSFTFQKSTTETEERAKRKERAQQYGNSAQRTAKADDGLHKLGVKIMKTFKDDISCERATILFFDSLKNEMFFYVGEKRYRFDQDSGIAGLVAKTGELLNVSDPYNHESFNSSLDKQTGFKTKSILCAPIRSRSGDGVVAVIQMLNKIGDGGAFTSFDEELIGNCAFRVSEALDLQFQTLVNAQIDMERMSLEGEKGNKPKHTSEISNNAPRGDEAPLYEGSRVMNLQRERDSFAEVRRKRVDEYGKEVRESKVGM